MVGVDRAGGRGRGSGGRGDWLVGGLGGMMWRVGVAGQGVWLEGEAGGWGSGRGCVRVCLVGLAVDQVVWGWWA